MNDENLDRLKTMIALMFVFFLGAANAFIASHDLSKEECYKKYIQELTK